MRKRGLAVFLSVVFMLINLSCTGYGLAENTNELHLYQEIPVEGTTRDVVSQILLEKTGVPFEVSNVVWSGNAYGIEDFGYEWNLQLDFNENYIGVNRLLLSSAQSARVSPEELHERLQSDLLQFIDVEDQLTTLYGEPDSRFFYTNSEHYDNKNRKYMFQSGTWEIGQMINVCEKDLLFQSYSIWGNVVLKTWVDCKNVNVAGQYLTRVMLYYYPDMETTTAMMAVPIVQFPSSSDD